MRSRGGSCVGAWDGYFTGWTCGAGAAPVSARGMKYMRLSTPSCSSIPLRSISLTGSALWIKMSEIRLMCKHNTVFQPFYPHDSWLTRILYTTHVKKEIENRHLSKTFFIFFGFSLAYFPIFCYYTFVMDFNRKSNDRLRRCYDG